MLSKALGFEEAVLLDLANTANQSYRLAKVEKKSDGSLRQTFDAFDLLKEAHERIKNRILLNVHFPHYLTGSLKGKDYVVNAKLHVGSKIVISEDVESFFPSTTDKLVFEIWNKFFGFSEDVSTMLTKLTTKDGQLPQGAKTSSFLANLAFWKYEYKIYDEFSKYGLVYSRYVDDITISSKVYLDKSDKTKVIKKVYGMLSSHGYKAKRKKHDISTSGKRMAITKLTVNSDHPSLTAKERSSIRAAVYQLENKPKMTPKDFNIVSGLVSKLTRMHKKEGEKLRARLRILREYASV